MIFPDTPEARDEIDRLLDPDDPILLESDRNRVSGSLADLARIFIRSIDHMTPEQKKAIRDAIREDAAEQIRAADCVFLWSSGIQPGREGE
jgi:hypothetical protein